MNRKPGDMWDRSWFALDGTLDEIDAEGETGDRFPAELARRVIAHFSQPGDWVVDPFAGFGTCTTTAVKMDRKAIGIERNPDRAGYAARYLEAPSRIICADALEADLSDWPECDLLFTSPPYTTVGFDDLLWGDRYFSVLLEIFDRIAAKLRPDAPVVIEVSNIHTEDGFRPLAFQLASVLAERFDFQRDFIRCNLNGHPAGPGVEHSHVLVFSNRPPSTPIAGSRGR